MEEVVTIEKLDHFGRGIAHINGQVVFVANALPEEICLIKIKKQKKKILFGTVLDYQGTSSFRQKEACCYANTCGGCQLQHLKKEEQLKWKEQKVKELAQKFAGIEEKKIKPILSSKKEDYRNKVTFHFENGKIGFYEEESHKVVAIQNCVTMDQRLLPVYEQLRTFSAFHPLLEEAVLRIGNETDEIMLSLKGKEKAEVVKKSFSSLVTSLYYNEVLLSGLPHITSNILGHPFFVSSTSFFQINEEMTDKLYQVVLDEVKKESPNQLLDLYCGTGTIGLLASRYAKKVIGIEVVKSAIEDAKENKKKNRIENIAFYLSRVEEMDLSSFGSIDFVIVDPPRSGLDSKTISMLKELKAKKVLYVSCDPVTLMRDLSLLTNYQVEYIQPVDMFPSTYHVECVSLLSLKESQKL